MKKWLIAFVGVLIHLLLGSVYAWSYFQTPIVELTGWSNSQVTWAFSLSIFMLGLSAAWAGVKLPKYGPRKLAIIGGSLYAISYSIAGLALEIHNLPLLYIGFGLIGGTGLGLAYVTPVATVSSWFTKHQGLATGMVVMGFGFGALVMSKILAPWFLNLSDASLSKTFLYIGFFLLLLLPALASFLKPSPTSQKNTVADEKEKPILNIKDKLFTKSFSILWVVFLINIMSGMVFISFQSPLLQDLILLKNPLSDTSSLAIAGANLIAISSISNGAGRLFWASISDKIGRINTFSILLLTQLIVFIALVFVQSPLPFAILVCIILLCYGGGFGLMPSLIKDTYASKYMSAMYGCMLTAWSIGGILGPQLVAYMKDNYADNVGLIVYTLSVVMLLVGVGLLLLYKRINSKEAKA